MPYNSFFSWNNSDTHKKYTKISVGIASPEIIRQWSFGEVTKPETINYKSLKPEYGGLFDERIFGPTKNYECGCGKYKKIKNRGKICERCGVQITESIVRRERMGHIELDEPVAHIWMLKASPARIPLILNMKAREVEEVVYFVSYVVLDGGTTNNLKPKMVMDLSSATSSKETRTRLIHTLSDIVETIDKSSAPYEIAIEMIEELKDISQPFSMDECAQLISRYTGAKFGIGAKAIEHLLTDLDLDSEINDVTHLLEVKKAKAERQRLIRRLNVLNDFRKSGNKLEWMIMHVIPVIPPDIRPIIQLDGGRFTTSEINDLYRRIIIRNGRLKKVKEMGAPSVIVNNEMRMLQEAVDALLYNERKARPVIGRDKRPLKSLTATLKGKQGRFRQNLLGKRVDYSGRSVIAVGPELKMYECGLPQEMALILFHPFIISRLIQYKYANNVKSAEKLIAAHDERVWEILEEVIADRPVLLNRAPTLHRLGIQAFEPKLIRGKAIRLHPLVTTAFNADFDGDQMAVHLPLSDEAVAEARSLMIASKNILGPKDGKPIVTPTQDMVLGNYFLTVEDKTALGTGLIFKDYDEAISAYETGSVKLSSIIAISAQSFPQSKFRLNPEDDDKLLITTVGKLIFNSIFPADFPYLNEPTLANLHGLPSYHLIEFSKEVPLYIQERELITPFKKRNVGSIISYFFKKYGTQKTAIVLDQLKNLGFKYSTISGTTVAASDAPLFEAKKKIFAETELYISEINNYYEMGMLTDRERHQQVVSRWVETKDKIQTKLTSMLANMVDNPIHMMIDSGARGNVSNFTQLVGMRGLMTNPKGDIIELPITSSFRDGLSVLEFFISTHGARKGAADKALKTADAGYLTRRLVDVAQEVIVTETDCGTETGFIVKDIIDTKQRNIIVPLQDRILGRYAFSDVKDAAGTLIVSANQLITESEVNEILKSNVNSVYIRSALTCESKRGVCQRCYGINLTNSKLVEVGEPIGIIAAQSIGEPGTQLTMQTFHTGGVVGSNDITQGLPRVKELVDVTSPKGAVAIISDINGTVTDIQNINGIYQITVDSAVDHRQYRSQFNTTLRVNVGDEVKVGAKLTEGSINLKQLLEVAGPIAVQDYILKEMQRVYRLQGIEIAEKYIEIIARQMLKRLIIIDQGDSDLLPGQTITISEFKRKNSSLLAEHKKPIIAKQVIYGIKKVPLQSESFLSAASFQDTTRVLTKAVIAGASDSLLSLKENVILGNIIPAGTGLLGSTEIIEAGQIAYNQEY